MVCSGIMWSIAGTMVDNESGEDVCSTTWYVENVNMV